jgi:hypothetical protein
MGSSTTTRNFGMRRFTNLVRESRFRGLASGTELVLGTMVEVDPSDPTRIRAAVDNAIGGGGDVRTGNCGILWYEQDSQTYNDPRFGGAAGLLPQDLDTAPNGRMVQVLSGAGAKVWFRNTGDSETEPGLNYSNERAARTMVFGIGGATATTTIGELLGWDNSNKYLRITDVDDTYLTVDAVILH